MVVRRRVDLHRTDAALTVPIVALAACRPDAPRGSLPSTSGPPATDTTTPTPTTTSAPTTTEAQGATMTGVSLGFNNAEQGVVAPDGTPLLVVMRAGSV